MDIKFEINGKFDHSACADYMAKKYHACMIDGSLYLYNGAVYRCDYDEIVEQIHTVYPKSTSGQRKEVYNKLKRRAPIAHRTDPAIIAFKNGLIDLRQPADERKLMPFAPDIYVTHQLAVDYIDGPYTDTKEYEFLNRVLDDLSCGDEGVKKMLISLAAYCIYPDNPLRSYFVMVGKNLLGKDKMQALIEGILGGEECSFTSLTGYYGLFTDFGRATLCGKLANFGDDIPDIRLNVSQIAKLKDLINARTTITGKLKGRGYFSCVPVAKLIFSCYSISLSIPRYNYLDRLISITLKAHNDGYDMNGLDETMRTELQDPKVAQIFGAMCIKALDEMKITTKEARFPIYKSTQNKKVDDTRDNDLLRSYINSRGLDATAFYGKTVHQAYQEYVAYLRKAGINGYTERAFQRRLFHMFDVCTVQKRFGAERHRVIVPMSSVTPKDTGMQ